MAPAGAAARRAPGAGKCPGEGRGFPPFVGGGGFGVGGGGEPGGGCGAGGGVGPGPLDGGGFGGALDAALNAMPVNAASRTTVSTVPSTILGMATRLTSFRPDLTTAEPLPLCASDPDIL